MPAEFDIVSVLGHIALTRNLTERSRLQLAEHCERISILPRQRVLSSDSQGHHVYLVKGQMAKLQDGTTQRLTADAPHAPPVLLFADANADHVAASLTACHLLMIPADALATANAADLEVSDLELSGTETNLLNEIFDLIANKRLDLPTRPEIALHIQQLTLDNNSNLDALTDIIQKDATIAGGLLQATNSPLFRAAEPILSVRDAVIRLGFRNTRILTTNLALRQTFRARHAVTRAAMEEIWEEATLNSIFSFMVADAFGLLHRERALLAGLIAGIGAVPIIQYLEKRKNNLQKEFIDMLLPKLRSIVGILVVNYWALGEDLVTVAEHAYDWEYHATEPDYTSLVIVGRWSALLSTGKPVPPPETIPAFAVLGIPHPTSGGPIPEIATREQEFNSMNALFTL